jgi:hypothetical protein
MYHSGLVEPLTRAIVRFQKEADDAAWAGDIHKADRLQQQVDNLRQQEKAGELFYVRF